jgi:hypothetical protein
MARRGYRAEDDGERLGAIARVETTDWDPALTGEGMLWYMGMLTRELGMRSLGSQEKM